MTRFYATSLLLLLSWQLLLKGGVLIWYWANQKYIAAELCVNRDKPKMHCNGQCVLMQRLKAAEQEQRNAMEFPLRIVEKLELTHFITPSICRPAVLQETVIGVLWVKDIFSLSEAHLLALFQPPETA